MKRSNYLAAAGLGALAFLTWQIHTTGARVESAVREEAHASEYLSTFRTTTSGGTEVSTAQRPGEDILDCIRRHDFEFNKAEEILKR